MPARLRWVLSAYLFIFSILITFTGCKKNPHHPDPARGSLQNQYGECLPSNVHGIWYNGFPAGTDTNYVNINVYVTSPGSYQITTNKQNGVQFAASGIFSDTGLHAVRLKATGSFISPGAVVYPLTFDSSTCQIYIYVQDSAGLSMADNTWQFTAEGHVYKGTCQAYVYQIPQSPGAVSFEFTGHTASGDQDTVLNMGFYASDIYEGLDTVAYPASLTLYSYKTGKYIYTVNVGPITDPFSIHVRSNTTLLSPRYTNILIATFDGTVHDSAGNNVLITNAKFKAVN